MFFWFRVLGSGSGSGLRLRSPLLYFPQKVKFLAYICARSAARQNRSTPTQPRRGNERTLESVHVQVAAGGLDLLPSLRLRPVVEAVVRVYVRPHAQRVALDGGQGGLQRGHVWPDLVLWGGGVMMGRQRCGCDANSSVMLHARAVSVRGERPEWGHWGQRRHADRKKKHHDSDLRWWCGSGVAYSQRNRASVAVAVAVAVAVNRCRCLSAGPAFFFLSFSWGWGGRPTDWLAALGPSTAPECRKQPARRTVTTSANQTTMADNTDGCALKPHSRHEKPRKQRQKAGASGTSALLYPRWYL